MPDKVLVIGGGGREHALAWKLAESSLVQHVYVSPGNAGTFQQDKISNIVLDIKNPDNIVKWCRNEDIKLVVVGPEDPLANGISDYLLKNNIKCFGPCQKAAQIEASKAFAKAFMDKHNIPTARWKSFTNPEDAKQHIFTAPYKALVVKASGLAAGKGVIVAETKEEAVKAIDTIIEDKALSKAGETLVIEEYLEGEEISVLAFTDGTSIAVMPPAQDHKRLLDGDKGPNTGGMGAYCPCPQVSSSLLDKIETDIIERAVHGMKKDGIPYIGVLYAGLMLTSDGPKVLEFNCRFGDPECQVSMQKFSITSMDLLHILCQAFQFGNIGPEDPLRVKGLTYKDSGVDITKADKLVEKIKHLAKSTRRPGTIGSIGGFGAVFDIRLAGYTNPLLVSGTDGVGTKLKLAHYCNKHDTIGIDLVAMCVNDILTQGAEPLYFLDYFACSKLDSDVTEAVISGIAKGCLQANCVLSGGETAEMPGMYAPGDYDLAGFAVGAVERNQLLPKLNDITDGDVVIGISSSGVHSNGFSLIHKLMEIERLSYSQASPFEKNKTLGESFLVPTKIYVKSVLPLLKDGYVKGAAHITGGGLTENIPRILPLNCEVELDALMWDLPPVFSWISKTGNVSRTEMLRTFNCGLGMILIAAKEYQNIILNTLTESGEKAAVVGKVKYSNDGQKQVKILNFEKVLKNPQKQKKKVGVLISGSGTNLQALIDHTLDESNCSSAEIVLVISNVPEVEGLKRAKRANIPTKVISHKGYKSRVDFDMKVHEALIEAGVEIICLAGFMRIISAEFVKLWSGRLINIHPSLLPSFRGAHAHRDALAFGARITGCTVHFVEPEVDAGAIICQAAVDIKTDDTEETLRERVKAYEHKIFPQALELLASEKISLGQDKKIIWK
ncbi:trifunctional purine biosynthetic protein adenosine-3-like [Centruroides sculpturatus]|uniref:trifunctional purine biosynthetic protein adenosine-3-like n=1 Tax=Centruroides sculpturatus TaxID=218467 RepID=UPI000C6D0C2A|nr:trifunctional purine biosynthetic protein adenosine-3-like [Centruroides sculpturatus]